MQSCYHKYLQDESLVLTTEVFQTENHPIYQFPVVKSYGDDVDHGYIQCPIENEIYSFLTPWWIALYVSYSAGTVIIILFFIHRRILVRNLKAKTFKDGNSGGENDNNSPSRDKTDEVTQVGYRDCLFGSIAFAVLIALSIGIVGFFILIDLDIYGITYPICSASSVASCNNNLVYTWRDGLGCASGCLFSWQWSTGLFTEWPYDQRANGVEQIYGITYIAWTIMMIWWMLLKVYSPDLPVWFRIETALKNATVVFCSKKDEEPVCIEYVEATLVVRIIRKLEALFAKIFGVRKVKSACKVKYMDGMKYFEFQHVRYCWDEKESKYVIMSISPCEKNQELIKMGDVGLTTKQAENLVYTVGYNKVNVNVTPVYKALYDEFFQYLYIYQIGFLLIWYFFLYWVLATILCVVIAFAATVKIIIKRKAEKQIKEMTEVYDTIRVLRDGDWKTILCDELVPYDIVELEASKVVPADCVLLKGRCVMNESCLTGEPTPVPKVSIPEFSTDKFDYLSISNVRYILLCGTYIESVSHISKDEKAVAMVYLTGAHTQQGQLLRSILFPPPLIFKYNEHLKLVFAILIIVGVSMFILTLYLMGFAYTAIIYGLFTVSNIFNPLIPAAFLAGQARAASRLRQKGIFCVNLYRTFVAAKVKICCFDKTGTLTEPGLDFHSVFKISKNNKLEEVGSVEKLDNIFLNVMASCHELDLVPLNDGSQPENFKLVGNHIDTTMFNFSRSTMKDMSNTPFVNVYGSGQNLKILKRFEFERSTMSMSVLVQNEATKEIFVFTKGSFESVSSMSIKSSLPINFELKCNELASDGYYILGLGMKKIDESLIENSENFDNFVAKFQRNDAEGNLFFLGLLVFSNYLKSDTKNALQELKEGDVRCVMVTGDNIMTACKVSQDCKFSNAKKVYVAELIDEELVWRDLASKTAISDLKTIYHELKSCKSELAVSGNTFNYLKQSNTPLLPFFKKNTPSDNKNSALAIRSILPFIRIFARMKPAEKVDVVKYYMEIGVTAMVGDGANDCAALRMSHCGLALGNSNQQATIVAPFSTSSLSIYSVVTLLIEGRAALATANTGYKRLILYGQTIMILKLFAYVVLVNPSEAIWILSDSIVNCGLIFVLLRSTPAKKLAPYRPTSALLGTEILLSIGLQVLNIFVQQCVAFGILRLQPWFFCKEFDNKLANHAFWWTMGENYEAAILGFVGLFQLCTAALILNFGHDYRQAWYKNWLTISVTAVFVIFMLCLLFLDGTFINCLSRFNCGDRTLLEWWAVELDRSIGLGGGIAPPGCPCSEQVAYSETCENEYISCGRGHYNQTYHHNIFPMSFRLVIFAVVLVGFLMGMFLEGFVMVGPVRTYLRKKRDTKKRNNGRLHIVDTTDGEGVKAIDP